MRDATPVARHSAHSPLTSPACSRALGHCARASKACTAVRSTAVHVPTGVRRGPTASTRSHLTRRRTSLSPTPSMHMIPHASPAGLASG
eukprot:1725585-Prymnesium_polylepis.2